MMRGVKDGSRQNKPIVFSIIASGLLLFGLFLPLKSTPQIAHATLGNLFATTNGTGTDCTQTGPCDLATALSQSIPGDTIYVAQGTYTSAGEAVILVSKSITLLGGWDGTVTTPPLRDPETYPTTLDGENTRRGVYISGYIAPILEGFIITRGNASNSTIGPGTGGGIYSTQANPTITNNVITQNVAYTSESQWGSAGGVYLEHSNGNPTSAVISDNQITKNTASTLYRGEGGGLLVRWSNDMIIRDNTFKGNIAGSYINGIGGGVYLSESSAVVTGNWIQDNQASPADYGFGGGFYSQNGDITLNGNWIISNVSVSGNVTFVNSPNITVTNNIIAQNTGGGVYVRGSDSVPVTGTLVNNTIAQNGITGVSAGWGAPGYSALTLTNNIITGHTTGIYANPDSNTSVVDATHTLFYNNQNNTDGTTITSTDEITGRDPSFLNPAGQDFHLDPNSPAVDAGTTVPWLVTDIDGDPRPLPIGGDYEIGADEAYWLSAYLPLVIKAAD